MATTEQQQLLDAIARGVSPLAEVRAALLFGSRATGKARSDSDIDIALLLDESGVSATPSERLRVLIGALARELAADRLDLVVLNDAPPALAFRVLKHGLLAFERDPADLHRFRVRTYRVHADYAPVERFFREATRRRALAGANRG